MRLKLISIALITLFFFNKAMSQDVIATTGDYKTFALGSVSYTIGETFTETFGNEKAILTQGFQQPQASQNNILHLKLFLEGLFNSSSGIMNEVYDANNEAPYWGAGIADNINVELIQPSIPYSIVTNFDSVSLNTQGNASINIPSIYNSSYYISIKNRNHVETWSANPISFANGNVNFDFTTAANQSYGDNLIEMDPGKFAIYTGDVIQDQVVNIWDLATVFDMLNDPNAPIGYYPEDLTGDGIVNIWDLALVFDNMNNGIGTINPLNAKKK